MLALAATAQAQPESESPQRVDITNTAQTYLPADSTAATKTSTPSLFTPQSLQVVPRAVLNDQKALTLTDAVRNVAGVGTTHRGRDRR